MFESVKNLFAPKAKVAMREPLLGLSQAEALSLQDLKEHPSWQAYLSAIDSVINLYGESLLQTRDSAALHEARGVILGLRRAISLVDETKHRVDELRQHSTRRAESELEAARQRGASLYGTPGWQPAS